jgi:hypothetical protein
MAVECNPRCKKLGSNQAQFEKVLHKCCPMHMKAQHTLFESVSLHKSLNAPLLPQDRKRKDQEDDDEGDKLGAQNFQDPKNSSTSSSVETVAFPPSVQKLALREILWQNCLNYSDSNALVITTQAILTQRTSNGTTHWSVGSPPDTATVPQDRNRFTSHEGEFTITLQLTNF